MVFALRPEGMNRHRDWLRCYSDWGGRHVRCTRSRFVRPVKDFFFFGFFIFQSLVFKNFNLVPKIFIFVFNLQNLLSYSI